MHDKVTNAAVLGVCALAMALTVALGMPSTATADEADARRLLKAMSDYMAAQEAISFGFDITLEVVTKEEQKLALASSGAILLIRPDSLRVARTGGFADVEMSFDGETLTLLGKSTNLYTQIDAPGTIDNLIDELREKYKKPLPAADLLLSNAYQVLMANVVDTKDLGSGVIGGVECDHLAFRTEEVDWQIWIAQSERPYPCKYVVTSKQVTHGPQYSIQIRDWKTGSEVAAGDFVFKNSTSARKVDLKELKDMVNLPEHFVMGAAQ